MNRQLISPPLPAIQTSVVRSISMDSWSYSEVLSILEGGNKQLNDFFERHDLSSSRSQYEIQHDEASRNRYKTNAAMFYKTNLSLHVRRVEESGAYKGRDSFRKHSRRRATEVGKAKKRSCAAECNLDSESPEASNAVGP